tara:strand:+ start:68 stop:1225 length:1158 start_codon:yes stop_codon:yes gene_type:complete
MANPFLNSSTSRSVLLDALMDKQNRRYAQEQNPSSIGEAFARTGTRLVDAFSQKKLVDDELERRKTQRGVDREAFGIYNQGVKAKMGYDQSNQDMTGVDSVDTYNDPARPMPPTSVLEKAIVAQSPDARIAALENPNISDTMYNTISTLSAQKQQDDLKYRRERELAKIAAGAELNETKFGNANTLRDEHTNVSKDFVVTKTAWDKMKTIGERAEPTAAGDMSLMFGFMKINDPNSSVREGEYATAQNAGSTPQLVVAAYNRALTGVKLGPDQRKDFLKVASEIYGSKLTSQTNINNQYEGLATRFGVKPENVIVDFTMGDQFINGVLTNKKETEPVTNYISENPQINNVQLLTQFPNIDDKILSSLIGREITQDDINNAVIASN